MNPNPPKIALALSGAAARSSFYIGFLEELDRHNIPIHAIAAQSGAAVVAAAYACGTLEQLKHELFKMGRKELMALLKRGREGGGWYSLDIVEDYIREHFTKGKTMAEVLPRLTFVAADLDRGEIVQLTMGDMARACRITCTIPGVFEPVTWGNRTLVDGGLLSYIPADIARQSGADIVVGVSVRATKHMFYRKQLIIKDWYNKFKRNLFVRPAKGLWDAASKVITNDSFTDYIEEMQLLETESAQPRLFSVLGRSIDLAIVASNHTNSIEDQYFGCDVLIQQGVAGWGEGVNVGKMESLYKEGLAAGQKLAPRIQQYIENYNPQHHEQIRFITD